MTVFRTHAALWTLAGLLSLSGLTGIAEPVHWGHYGFHTGEWGQSARVTLRHGVLGTAPRAGYAPPRPEDFSLHHPFLVFYPPIVASVAVLGDTVWAVRLPTLVITLLTALLLGFTVNRYWDGATAVLATAVYCVCPMTTAFAHNPDTQPPAILGLLLAVSGYAAFITKPSRQNFLVVLLGFILALGSDWAAYLSVAMVSIHAGGRALWLWDRRPKWLAIPADLWIGLSATLIAILVIGSFLLYVHFHAQDGLGNTWGALTYRLSSDWGGFVRQQSRFVGGMYGGVLVTLALLGLLRMGLRLLRGTPTARDIIPFSFVFGNVVWAFLFPQAANIHVYRSMMLAVPVAIFAAELTVDAGRMVAGWPRAPRIAPWVRPLPGLLLLGHTLWLGATTLVESRRVGGTMYHGAAYDPEQIKMATARYIHATTSRSAWILFHPALRHRREVLYNLDRTHVWAPPVARLLEGDIPPAAEVAWFDGEALSRRDREALASAFSVDQVDRYLIVRLDQQDSQGIPRPDRRFRFRTGETGWLERWLQHPVLPKLVLEEVGPTDSAAVEP
ncbi:MAG: ArnT family glycosyltransferase [Myxococcota bacterium]